MTQPCLCIHGHFYQPPRENPWIEDIERQESAAPFHDWNERIYQECYRPNSRARIYGERRTIVDIVNNFEIMSFNFGPTLLGWLNDKHPETYKRIIEADRRSVEARGGHGNALAQCYNHMIMPLANRRDKITQVQWGIEDFRRHFGRDPEGMWLPETAVNEETLEVLVDSGIRFTILEPHQAQCVRSFGENDWRDVSAGNIDPKLPYRYFPSGNQEKFIDIFFYDGPISRSVGFEHLVRDAKAMMDRIEGAKSGDRPQLIHIATDGETYGHHKHFGDRTLVYLLHTEAPKRGYRVVNYGQFLEENPPAQEVKIKAGENGEGTAWSCPHGVRRWRDHCGCRADGPPEWNQHWRKPLREALDWLRDEIAQVFEGAGSQYLTDVWGARDEYVRVILNRQDNLEAFLSHQTRSALQTEETKKVLQLLEMERYAMLMYTSCGWFFTEMSGIETIQILQYAARAAQLACEISGRDFEKEFIDRLASAPSNVRYYGNGKGVFERCVKDAVVDLRRVASYYAIGSIFKNLYGDEHCLNIYCYDLEVLSKRTESAGNVTVNFGRVKVSSRVTSAKGDFLFAVFKIDPYDFRCAIKDFADEEEYHKLEAELFEGFQAMPIFEAIEKCEASFGGPYYGLKDLLFEDRLTIIQMLTHETLDKVSGFYEQVYDEALRMSQLYQSIRLPVPAEFKRAVEYILNRRIPEVLREFAGQGFNLKKAGPLYRMMDTAASLEIEIQKKQISKFLSEELEKKVKEFAADPSKERVSRCLTIQRLARRMCVPLDQGSSQEVFFLWVKRWKEEAHTLPEAVAGHKNQIAQLMEELRISGAGFNKLLRAA